MRELVFFLEEQSAREMLDSFLPKLLDENIRHRCIDFEGNDVAPLSARESRSRASARPRR